MKTPNLISPPHHLLVLLTYSTLNEEERNLALHLIRQVMDWSDFFDLAQRNKVTPILYYNLKEIGGWSKMPAEVQTRFEQQADHIRQQNEDRNLEAKRFLSRFVQEGIAVALIKGVSFGQNVYHNPYYKRMNDIDLLVKREQCPQIYRIYEELDYFFLAERIDGDREKSDAISHLAPHYVSKNRKCVIGTQWGLKTLKGKYKIDYDQIWERMRPIEFQGLQLQVMSPEDNLLNLCIHLGYFKIAARDLMDFYNLIRVNRTEFDWIYFKKIVLASNSHNKAWFALFIVNRFCPMLEIQELCQQLETRVSWLWKRGANKKTRHFELMLNMFSDIIQDIEKCYSAFDATHAPKEKWQEFFKMWGLILFPSREKIILLGNIHLPNGWKVFRGRFTVPFRIFWTLVDEAGWIVLVGLIVKTVVDVFKDTMMAPFRRRTEKHNLEAYAKRLGISLEDLKQLNDHFQ